MINPCSDACQKGGYQESCAERCAYAALMKENEALKRELEDTQRQLRWAKGHLNTDT